MWATTHMRGNFFVGLQTTSWCKALHSQIMRYIESRYNLIEFMEHYDHCLDSLHNNEVEADFRSMHGFPIMQT